jgi:2-polyprenyl-3-methyl-5-hydroxy-6-metoxy-1,4-benzoquinol methylase
MIPGMGGSVEVEHLHRYALACLVVRDKIVLDVACGEGYGTAMLAAHAKAVSGVDISKQAVDHASLTYRRDNVRFEVASCTQFPCKDKSVDVVVSFETIEHISEHEQMFAEIKRVLKDDGLLIMSSPDKRYYSEARNYENPFHVRELHGAEPRWPPKFPQLWPRQIPPPLSTRSGA